MTVMCRHIAPETQSFGGKNGDLASNPHYSKKCVGPPRKIKLNGCLLFVVVVVVVIVVVVEVVEIIALFTSKTAPVFAQYLVIPEPIQLMRASTVATGQLPQNGTRSRNQHRKLKRTPSS